MKVRPALLLLLLPGLPLTAGQIVTHQAADIVLGQTDFVSNLVPATPTAASLEAPGGVAVDPTTGKVFVADTKNNRVLRYDSVATIMTSGASAEAVLGQPDLTSKGSATTQKEMDTPYGLAIDKNGTLWVADASNNRVLRFDNASAKPNFAVNADGVLGQPNFSTKAVLTPPTQAGMYSPRAVAVDGNGTLWVADSLNNRVLRFDDAATAINGANADGVLGAPNFVVNYGGAVTQYAMHDPAGLAVDTASHLWVADYSSHRVLRFDNAPNLLNGALATRVIGQPDFTTSTPLAPPTAASLNRPAGLAIDAAGALWVSDGLNSRILRFDAAAKKGNSPNANAVLGQADFITKGPNITDTGISASFGLAFSPTGALWVADTLAHRVLHYTPQATPAAAKAAAIALTVSGKKKIATTAAKARIKGGAACADGVARIEYRIGKKGGFKIAAGTSAWSFKAKLPPGVTKVLVRAVSTKGIVSPIATIKITRS